MDVRLDEGRMNVGRKNISLDQSVLAERRLVLESSHQVATAQPKLVESPYCLFN